jgi:5-methylcytosine-specific restriction endonuclease McrA
MIAFWLAAMLAVTPTPRDPKNVRRYRAQHQCPASCALYKKTAKGFRLYWKCGGCDVDHICPLKCGGPDTFDNMHWLDSKANRSKGADCSACKKP